MKTFKENLLKILISNRSAGLNRKLGKENRINIKKIREEYIEILKESDEMILPKSVWREGDIKTLEQLVYEYDYNLLPKNISFEFRSPMTFANSKIVIDGVHIFKMDKSNQNFFGKDPYFLGGIKLFENIKKEILLGGIIFNIYYTINTDTSSRITLFLYDSVFWWVDFKEKSFEILNEDYFSLLSILVDTEMDVNEFKTRVAEIREKMGFMQLIVVTIRRTLYAYYSQKSIAPKRETFSHIDRGKVSGAISVCILSCRHCGGIMPSSYMEKGVCFYGNHKIAKNMTHKIVLFKKEI